MSGTTPRFRIRRAAVAVVILHLDLVLQGQVQARYGLVVRLRVVRLRICPLLRRGAISRGVQVRSLERSHDEGPGYVEMSRGSLKDYDYGKIMVGNDKEGLLLRRAGMKVRWSSEVGSIVRAM